MNMYKVIVEWSDGDRMTYYYEARGIRSAIKMCLNEFFHHTTPFEIVSVEKEGVA
jgi:hypothetical protein